MSRDSECEASTNAVAKEEMQKHVRGVRGLLPYVYIHVCICICIRKRIYSGVCICLLMAKLGYRKCRGARAFSDDACLPVNFMMKVRTSTPVPWVRLQLLQPWSGCASPAADGFQPLAVIHRWCCVVPQPMFPRLAAPLSTSSALLLYLGWCRYNLSVAHKFVP